MGLAYPVAYAYLTERRAWSRVRSGALVDSTYHVLEGIVAGASIGAFYRPLPTGY
jgi:hypothetical protein